MSGTFRHASLFFNGRKVGEMHAHTNTIEEQGESRMGDEGWMGESEGPVVSSLSAEAVVPVGGINGSAILRALLNRKYVDIGLGIVDGKIQKQTMKVIRAEYTSDAKTGTLDGRFEFRGGEPELV